MDKSVISEDAAKALANDIAIKIKAIFPNSGVSAKVTGHILPSISIFFTLGKDTTEFANGYAENDPAMQRITVWLDKLPLKVESGSAGTFTIKAPVGSHLAYGRVKVGWRNFTADESKVADKIAAYFMKLRNALIANIDNIDPRDLDLVKSKIGL
jgi:hypothetical protein